MQLYRIRGGSKKDLHEKKYTIGVGISLGNKWFTVENIVGLVKWSLAHTKDKVIIYVADSIHAINLEVRKRISFDKASLSADVMGDEILLKVKLAVEKQFSAEEISKISYVKWKDIVGIDYQEKIKYLHSFYEINDLFKKTIHDLVHDFVAGERRGFSESEVHRLGMYIIEELPELLNRVSMNGITCDAYAYPFDGDVTKLTERIQIGEIFPEIKKYVMDTEPKVFLEVR